MRSRRCPVSVLGPGSRVLGPGSWVLGLAILVAASAPAAAQTAAPAAKPLSVSLVGGLNSATMSTPFPEVMIPELSLSQGRRVGFVGGVLLDIPVAAPLAIQTGGLLSFKGTTMKAAVMDLGTAEIDARMVYLDVPALARVGVAKSGSTSAYLLVGGTLGLRLSADVIGSSGGFSQSESITSETSAVDFGLTIGGRVDVGRGIIDVRYTHGLVNVAPETGPAGETIKHRAISFMGGWRF